jgi:hypothetical protein
MRQPQNAKRGRGRGRRGNGGGQPHVPNRNTSYESNGPDVKLRGNAQQLFEKYSALAIDAASSGERISAEAYSQFADHYYRLHLAAVGAVDARRQTENNDEQPEQPQNKPEQGSADAAQSGDAGGEEQAGKSADAAPVKARAPGRPRKTNIRDNGAKNANADASTEVKSDSNISEAIGEKASDLPDVASGDVASGDVASGDVKSGDVTENVA